MNNPGAVEKYEDNNERILEVDIMINNCNSKKLIELQMATSIK